LTTTENSATTTTTRKPKTTTEHQATTSEPKTATETTTFELKITPSMYRLIDEAFRERLHDFERKMGALIFRKLMDAEDVKFLEHDAFEEFDKLFNLTTNGYVNINIFTI
jgi:ABC-type Zn2+ transport system substrate-binding protein/surface adhesin